MSQDSIEKIEINAELKEIGVREFYREETDLHLQIGERHFLFKIEKERQDTLVNLVKAAKLAGLSDDMLTVLKFKLPAQYSRYLKLPDENQQKQQGGESKSNAKSDAEKSGIKEHYVFKHGAGISLAEQIKIGDRYVFLQIIDGKPVISNKIEIPSEKKVLHPRGYTPILEFQYQNEDEIRQIINDIKNKSIDDFYFESKSFWKKFVKATHEQIVLFTADSIFTFFQDLFVTTHYVMLVARVGSGKGAILITFSYLGYRVVLGGNMSGASILDLFGTLDEGQIVIAEDELNNIKSDSNKWQLYTIGYDKTGRTTRTLDGSTSSRHENYYPAYCYKIFGAESSLDRTGLGGLIDRNFEMNILRGKPEFYIKNLFKRRLSPNYKELLEQIISFRKRMLIFRLLHADDLFKEIRTNIYGRALELTGPTIDLFYGLSENKKALREILPVLSYFKTKR